MAEPRGPTDEEDAPLLNNGDHQPSSSAEEGGIFASFIAATKEPLSLLSKILLVVCLLLLLLTSVFVGLFAGAEHKLKHREEQPPTTVTSTQYATQTTTQIRTTTYTSVPTQTPYEPPCTTTQCVTLAASILSSLDPTVDPCDDFYQFTNGGWLKENPLPAAKASFSQFQKLAQNNVQIIKDIITRDPSPETSPADAASLKKLKDLYQSCMNEATLEEIGHEPLLNITRELRKAFRGQVWDRTSPKYDNEPLQHLDDKVSKVGLTAATAYLHTRGVSVLFSMYIDGDAAVDPDFMTVQFSQDGLGLPAKEYYEETSVVTAYTRAVASVLEALDETADSPTDEERSKFWPPIPWPPWGGDAPKENKTERSVRLAESVADFEIKLAKAHLDLDILYQDPFFTYNPYTFDNFTSHLPEIDFPAYIAAFTPRNFPEKIIVSYPPYLKSISRLISETNAEVLEAYFVARTALSYASYLGQTTQVWKAKRSLDELLRGLKKGAVEDRDEWCLARVEDVLGFAAGRFFVQETFGGKSQIKAAKVIDDIITSFKASLPHLEWMDKESAQAASEKATAIRVKVGYPFYPNTTSDASVFSYYRLVKPDPTRFLDNVVSATRAEVFRMWLTLGKMRNKDAWEMFPSTVNAYFNPPANEIVFPAGILRPPFFSQDWPTYLSYASFGGVAAHELTHAFDSAGRMYNQRGKLEEWWTNSTSQHFDERKNCIAEQYSKYTVDDGKGGVVHVNGNLTSGENIGDAGLIYAYHAWKAQESEGLLEGSEYTLPGLQDYTREQLFFIAYGRIWGRNMKTAAAVQQVRTDPHSPARYRVDGTLSNIPEFAKAFNCPKKTPKLTPVVGHLVFQPHTLPEEMQLLVTYKGTNHNVSLDPEATFLELQEMLEELTNVPPSLQKLLYRGKKTVAGEADSITVADVGLKDGLKVTLMGSTNEELSGMRDAEKETRRRDEIMKRRAAAGPSKVYSTPSSKDTKYKFHRIEPLPYLPNPEAARAILEKLASDPAIKHVMQKHEFQVGVLTELAPHENPTLLGLNVNAGQSIKLRLRTDAYDGMRTYKETRRVLCHELTHNVFGDHDDNFKTLNSQLNREVAEFEAAVARGSRTLGSIGDAYEPDTSLSSSLMDSEVQSYVLGGGVGAASALGPSREEMRRRAADAALERQRKEEQEIEDRCGSGGPAALQ
ncbi:hypothetical protein FRB90_010985 [Tulasnella sp. 427]|nr:hypothetical protein FRB90_010985 [Tulasnella sp. 427]